MATTIEELQILLKCDATQAQATLESLQKAVDKTVDKMTNGNGGGQSYFDKVGDKVKAAVDTAERSLGRLDKAGGVSYVNDMRSRAQSAMSEASAVAKTRYSGVDTEKLTGGTQYERLAEKLKLLENNAAALREKMAAIGESGDNPTALLTLQTRLDTIEKKAEKVAQEMAKIEDEAASNGSSETASNVEQTGNAAENAAPKVERYGKAVKNAGSSSGFFGRMSKTAHGIFSKFGGSFKKHEGFLSKFGKTLKRVIMRMMAMGLVRGVIRGFTQGLQMLAKASPAAAEQFGRFTAMTKAVKAALGSAALAVLNAFASVLYNVASAAVTAANAVARFFGALGGGKYFAVSMADGFDNLSDSMSGAGGAAKGMLADFDELNVIGQQGGGGGGGAGSIGNATVSEQDASSIFADLLKNNEFEKAGEYINKKLGEISDKIAKWFTDLDKKNYGKKFGQIINGIFSDPKAFEKAGKAVAGGLNTVIHFLNDLFGTVNWKNVGGSLASGLNSIFTNVDWASFGQMLGRGVNGLFNTLQGFLQKFDAKKAARSLTTALKNTIQTIDWTNIGRTATDLVASSLDFVSDFLYQFDYAGLFSGIFDLVFGAIERLFSNPVKIIEIFFKSTTTILKVIGSLVISWIASLFTSIDRLLGMFIPNYQPIGEKIKSWWDETTQSIENKTDAVFNYLGDEWDKFAKNTNKASDAVDGLGRSMDKLPKKLSTSWTLNANVVASSSGGASAQVNHPSFNINMAMASGGIAYGETLARIGEYPNAHMNPEVVAPLNKLQGILEKANGGNKANSADVKRQNELLTEQNRLLRIIAQKEIKLSPSPELGQVVTKATALYGAV